jgi:phage terminase small subunit
MTYNTKTGGQCINPLIKIASKAKNDAVEFGNAFGLSPVGRLRLSGIKPPPAPGKFDGPLK